MADSEDQKQAQDAEREIVKLWRAWRTVKEMCQDRGYELSEEEVRVSLEDFRRQCVDPIGGIDRKKMAFGARPTPEMMEKYRNLPTAKQPEPDPPTIGTIWVEFSPEPSIGVKQMRNFLTALAENNFYTGIFVSQNAVTAPGLRVVPAFLPRIIECFQESDLLVNITHHELVPKHVLLSATEKKTLLERYRLKETQLPRIQTNDPVAKYFGLRRGQVVKIIRKSETAGRYASYRWCL